MDSEAHLKVIHKIGGLICELLVLTRSFLWILKRTFRTRFVVLWILRRISMNGKAQFLWILRRSFTPVLPQESVSMDSTAQFLWILRRNFYRSYGAFSMDSIVH